VGDVAAMLGQPVFAGLHAQRRLRGARRRSSRSSAARPANPATTSRGDARPRTARWC
jgi:hypothetical protein